MGHSRGVDDTVLACVILASASTSGHNLICMQLTTAPQQDETEAAIASSPGTAGDALATCSGSGDPAAAACYEGSAGALGVKETVKVNVKKYSSGAGTMDLTGTGVKGFTCADHSFTKTGQEVTLDLRDCLPSGVTVPDVKYCSDSDEIKVTVKDKLVPLPIVATLKKVSCAESNEIDFATCTGSSDPPGDECYDGKAGALGPTEDVKVSVKSYSGGKGTMDLSGSGIESFTCKDHSFTKSGQEISVDVSDCAPHAITVSDVKYCSDSDQIKVTVKDKTVPLPISAMLSKTTCAKSSDSELASESPTQELPSIASSPVNEDFVQGGTLKLGWKDCGDSSYHAKVTSLTPSTLTIGAKTHVVGQGNVDESVTAGSLTISSKAMVGPAEHLSGDVCKPKTFNLPMGLATITWDGLKCPVAKGQADVGVNVKLAASIPAKLARTTIDLKATSSSGHNLICMQMTTAPQQDETVAAIGSGHDMTGD